MIVSVCSDKGAPGVTTVATALALVWPGDKVLVEADPSGADLPFRLRRSDSGAWLNPDPSIASLAAVARLGLPAGGIPAYAQPTSLGVPVIAGALTAERFSPLKSLWPQIAEVLSAGSGTVLCDLGRVQPGHAALPVARASAVVLLVARADLGGLFHLRERVVELAQSVGDPSRPVNPVAVLVTGPPKTRSKALAETAALLESVGSPAEVVGFVPDDRQGAEDLWAGVVTRRLAGSPLIRSVRQIAEHMLRTRPDFASPDAPALPLTTVVSEPLSDSSAPTVVVGGAR